MWTILAVFVVLLLIAGYLLVQSGYHSYFFFRQPKTRRATVEWKNLAAVPLAEKKYTPQGMTWVGGRLVFANSWKNTNSRVYEFNPESMICTRYFDMPDGAVHTSGLAWDGDHLWAVDYISNFAYCFSLESSFEAGRPVEVGRFATTLKGTSACCFITWNGERLLAVSDFMNSRQTVFIEHEEALKKQTARDHIVFSYTNEGFSQGLEFAKGFLYESENKFRVDVVNQIDLDLLQKTKNSSNATIRQYYAPNGGVEDLAFDGQQLWTSDEVSFRFYRGTLAS